MNIIPITIIQVTITALSNRLYNNVQTSSTPHLYKLPIKWCYTNTEEAVLNKSSCFVEGSIN
jgi:hypothetical protein